jgi:hypothetical protein
VISFSQLFCYTASRFIALPTYALSANSPRDNHRLAMLEPPCALDRCREYRALALLAARCISKQKPPSGVAISCFAQGSRGTHARTTSKA